MDIQVHLGRAVDSYQPLYQVARATSSMAFNTSRNGASVASLGSLCHCLSTLLIKIFS